MSKRATKRNRRKLQRRARELLLLEVRHHPYFSIDMLPSTVNYSNRLEDWSFDRIMSAAMAAVHGDLLKRLSAVPVAPMSRLGDLDLTGVKEIRMHPLDFEEHFREGTLTIEEPDPRGLLGGLYTLQSAVFVTKNAFMPRGHLGFDPPAHEREKSGTALQKLDEVERARF